MSRVLEQTACPLDGCNSSDAFTIYEEDGKVTGWCFSCNRFVADPYKNKKEDTPIESAKHNMLEEIARLPIRSDISRSLGQSAMDHFQVRTELSQADGQTVVAHFYPYTKDDITIAYKARKLPKDMFTVGHWDGLELFGQAQAKHGGNRKLWITEGEIDAISLWQALKGNARDTQWEGIDPSVVSICGGAGSAVRDISRNIEFVKQFEQIILVFDKDEAGKKATLEVLKLIPEALVVTLEEKDANEMVMKGKSTQLAKAALFNAQRHKPSSVVSVEDVFDRAIAKPVMGLSWPWPTLTKSTHGIHRKKIYGLGAGVGIGKSDWAKTLQSHLISHHGLPIGSFSLEEDVGRTLKGIAGKIHNKLYHVPGMNYPDQELSDVISELKGKVFLYDHFGVKDWEDIRTAIRYMVVSEGVKDIFIDPLTALVSHLHASEANDELNGIMGDLAGLTHELDFSAYYFSHLNPPLNGVPHERGGKVHEQQLTGSRAMMRWSNYLFGLERNKDPELDETVRNTSYLVVLKDREFGSSARFPIYYNQATGSFLEPQFGMF